MKDETRKSKMAPKAMNSPAMNKPINPRPVMKLQLFSYTVSKHLTILVSIQLSKTAEMWGDCPATIHECDDWKQAGSIAQGIANITGKQVRMTKLENANVTQEQVGSNPGSYFNRTL